MDIESQILGYNRMILLLRIQHMYTHTHTQAWKTRLGNIITKLTSSDLYDSEIFPIIHMLNMEVIKYDC